MRTYLAGSFGAHTALLGAALVFSGPSLPLKPRETYRIDFVGPSGPIRPSAMTHSQIQFPGAGRRPPRESLLDPLAAPHRGPKAGPLGASPRKTRVSV